MMKQSTFNNISKANKTVASNIRIAPPRKQCCRLRRGATTSVYTVTNSNILLPLQRTENNQPCHESNMTMTNLKGKKQNKCVCPFQNCDLLCKCIEKLIYKRSPRFINTLLLNLVWLCNETNHTPIFFPMTSCRLSLYNQSWRLLVEDPADTSLKWFGYYSSEREVAGGKNTYLKINNKIYVFH